VANEWRHYAPLTYARHNLEPRTLETIGVNAANRLVQSPD